MNESHIDRLLQIVAPRRDVPLIAGDRARDDYPAFESHFRRVSAASPPPTVPTPRPSSSRGDDSAEYSPAPAERPVDRSPAPAAAPARDSSPVAAAAGSSQHEGPPEDRTSAQQHGSDEATDPATTAAPSQGASTIEAGDEAIEDEKPQPAELSGDIVRQPVVGQVTDAGLGEGDQAAAEAGVDTVPVDAKTGPETRATDSAGVENQAQSDVRPKEPNATQAHVAADAETTSSHESTKLHSTELAAESGSASDADEVVAVDANGKGRDPRRAADGAGQRIDSHGARNLSGEESASPPTGQRPAAADRSVEGNTQADHGQRANDTTQVAGTDGRKAGGRKADPTGEKSTSGRLRSVVAARTDVAQVGPLAVGNVSLAAPIHNAPQPDAIADAGTKLMKDTVEAKESLLSTFARFDRSGALGSRSTPRSADGQDTPHVDPARFVGRVVRAIHTAHVRGGPLHLRLSPPELGSIRLELAVKQGVLTASVETDSSVAKQILLDNLPALRDRLAEQNVRIERFDVDVRREDGGDQPNLGPQHRRQHHEGRHDLVPPNSNTAGRGSALPQLGDDTVPVRRSITDTSINVIA